MLRRHLIPTLLLLLLCNAVPAQRIIDIRSTGADVEVTYELPLLRPAPRHASVVYPMLCNGSDTVCLDAVTVRGRRNARLLRRSLRFNKRQPMPDYIDAKTVSPTDTFTVSIPVADHPWLLTSDVTLCTLTDLEGCCNVERVSESCSQPYLAPELPTVVVVPVNTGRAGVLQKDNPVLLHVSKYRPYTPDRIMRKERGATCVYFPLNRITLYRDYRNNAATLDKIIDLTEQILTDSTSSVKLIQIIGFASIEGTVEHNQWLGAGRAEALKRYIQQRLDVPDDMFELANGGEAWSEFRDQLLDSAPFEGREEVIELIDREPNLDVRERRLHQLHGGRTFRYIQDNFLFDQRNSGYLRIYWDYKSDDAAQVINNATDLIHEQRYTEALNVLQAVKDDPRAWNAIGVAYYLLGQKEQATDYFRRAAADGNGQATENLRQMEK